MSDLLDFVMTQHGGADVWKGARSVTASVNIHGAFWPYKGQPGLLGVESVIADLTAQRITMTPFGEGRTLHFDAGEDLVTTTSGCTADRRRPATTTSSPGSAFRGLESMLWRPNFRQWTCPKHGATRVAPNSRHSAVANRARTLERSPFRTSSAPELP
ncbi:hypothetical protein [Streptomyces sp. NPDC054842]